MPTDSQQFLNDLDKKLWKGLALHVNHRNIMIDYETFQKSLQHLQVQYENYRTLDDSQPELMQEVVLSVGRLIVRASQIVYQCTVGMYISRVDAYGFLRFKSK